MALPLLLPWDQAQNKWKSQLDPIIALPINGGHIIKNVKLVSGANVVNHGLGANLQGWSVMRRRQFKVTGTPTAYDITDTQDSNQMPQLTLNLYCNQGTTANPVIVDIFVF